jgi:hypothetical protein
MHVGKDRLIAPKHVDRMGHSNDPSGQPSIRLMVRGARIRTNDQFGKIEFKQFAGQLLKRIVDPHEQRS